MQGNRLASAQGRDMGMVDEESDSARKVGIKNYDVFHLFLKILLYFIFTLLAISVSVYFGNFEMEVSEHSRSRNF